MRDGRVECNAIHPCGDQGFVPEPGHRLPELKNDLLKQIFLIILFVSIEMANLEDNSPMAVNQFDKLLLHFIFV
jgi:hypothetical protein